MDFARRRQFHFQPNLKESTRLVSDASTSGSALEPARDEMLQLVEQGGKKF